jgi:hypothetical protein
VSTAAGTEDVDANARPLEILDHDADHAMEARLDSAVNAHPRRGRDGSSRSDQDDRPATRHEWHRRLYREQYALQVGADHPVELLLCDPSEGSMVIDDGVGDDRIESPVPRLHILE